MSSPQTVPIADLLAEAVMALLIEIDVLRAGLRPVHHHNGRTPCAPGCPVWTRNAAEVALERWRAKKLQRHNNRKRKMTLNLMDVSILGGDPSL